MGGTLCYYKKFSSPSCPFIYFSLIFRRLAEAFHISEDSDPFNVRSSGSKFSDSLKDDARYVCNLLPAFFIVAYKSVWSFKMQ